MDGGLITPPGKKKVILKKPKLELPLRPIGSKVQDVSTRLEQRTKQRMMHKAPLKLCLKTGQWDVRALAETGKCAQVIKEMHRYGVSILGVSQMR